MNPHAALAREKKARRIADLIWSQLDADERRSEHLVERVGEIDQPVRTALAKACSPADHQHGAPSEETWTRVVEMLHERQLAESRCDLCRAPTPGQQEPTLCDRCAASCAAHARTATETARYLAETPPHERERKWRTHA